MVHGKPLILGTCLLQVAIDFDKDLIRTGKDGKSVYFKDIRPSNEEVAEVDVLEFY